jgi:hypothetical protein
VLDLIIQTSGVELFQAYGISAAPMPPATLASVELPDDCLGGHVNFNAPAFRGVLVLCVARETLRRSTDANLGVHNERDWVRELCNQLMGRVKNRLARYQVILRAGVPTVVDAPTLQRMAKNQTDLAYVFRTLTGSIVVWISGDFDRTSLVFSSTIEVAGEGDVVLF